MYPVVEFHLSQLVQNLEGYIIGSPLQNVTLYTPNLLEGVEDVDLISWAK